jgi:small subunit ribosomal protein S8
MNTDPIADLLTRIRNAVRARKNRLTLPYSNLKAAILEVMKHHGYIKNFKVVKSGTFSELEVELVENESSLNLKRISKPGQRIYVKKADIKPVLQGYGISILSTPKGVMTGDEARKAGLGGEMLCHLWR